MQDCTKNAFFSRLNASFDWSLKGRIVNTVQRVRVMFVPSFLFRRFASSKKVEKKQGSVPVFALLVFAVG